MAKITVDTFLEYLQRSDLLAPNKLEGIRDLALGFDDATEFARLLSKREIISRWQAAQLLAGRTQLHLGHYKLLERLGRGGMGNVFLAEHTTMNRRVALKVVSHKGDDTAAADQLRGEARAIGLLDHPNIIQAYDVDNEGDRFFIVMEYVPGRDLNAMVMDEGPLPMERAVDYIRQAAEGLAHAHERGMIHCDIKPSNLLVDANGTVKILDLGVARLSDEEESDDDSEIRRALGGTIDYQAPEHARDAADFDRRADIYSLGCTLYCLLAGHPPFPSGSQTKRILQHQTEPPPDLRSIRPDIPEDLNAICMKMLAKNPDDRYQSAGEVAEVLAAWTPPETLDSAQGDPRDEVLEEALGLNRLELNTFQEPLESSAVRRRKQTNTLAHLWIAATFVLSVVLFLIILILSSPDVNQTELARPIPINRDGGERVQTNADTVTSPPDSVAPPDAPVGPGDDQASTPAETVVPGDPADITGVPPAPAQEASAPPTGPFEAAEGSAAGAASAEPAAEPGPVEPPKPVEEPPKPEPPPKPIPVFATFPEVISLPPADAAGQWHFIGALEGPVEAPLAVELLGGTFEVRPKSSSQTRTQRVEFVLKETTPGETWTIESNGTPIATLERDTNRLVYRWESTDPENGPELLQYTVLRLLCGEETRDLTLTRPVEIPPLTGNFNDTENGLLRRPLPELPIRDANSFRVAFTEIVGPTGAVSLKDIPPLSPTDNRQTFEGPELSAASIELTFILSASRDSVNLQAKYSLHGGGKPAYISRKQLLTLQGLAAAPAYGRASEGAREVLTLAEAFAQTGRVHFRAYREVGDMQIDVIVTKDPPPDAE